MAALFIRPTDCLAGCAFFGAHRGVHAAPAPRRPTQQQQQDSQVPARAIRSIPGQSRPVRGRANGRQRGQRSPPAAGAGSPPHKRVMENVVILKRGEEIPTGVTEPPTVAPPSASQSGAQAEKAETVAAEDKRSPQSEKAVTLAAVENRGAQAEKVEPVAAADQRGPDTQAKKAEAAEHHGADATKAEAVVDAHQSVPQAKEEDKNVPVAAAAAEQSDAQAKKAEAAPPATYSGLLFVVAPEPRALPIPVLLLKPRLRARGGSAFPTAAS